MSVLAMSIDRAMNGCVPLNTNAPYSCTHQSSLHGSESPTHEKPATMRWVMMLTILIISTAPPLMAPSPIHRGHILSIQANSRRLSAQLDRTPIPRRKRLIRTRKRTVTHTENRPPYPTRDPDPTWTRVTCRQPADPAYNQEQTC